MRTEQLIDCGLSLSSSYLHYTYLYKYILFIYLYYTYFVLICYTPLLYYILIKNIFDSTSYFTLALFPSYSLHDSELFKISLMLAFLESNRSRIYHM